MTVILSNDRDGISNMPETVGENIVSGLELNRINLENQFSHNGVTSIIESKGANGVSV